jgi:hypothetical protein
MSDIIQIFCEDNHHFQVLGHLLSKRQRGKAEARIVQTSGVRGARAFKEGYNRRTGVQSKANIFFRDRDFDFPPTDQVILKMPVDEKDTYVSHRTTIENYLIETDMFLAYIKRNHPNIDHLHDSISIIKLFTDAAIQLKAYAAVRHTLGFFRGNYSFGTSWTKGSGHLPDNLDENACIEQGFSLIETQRQKICPIDKETFLQKFHTFYERFDDDFYQNQLYWVWFNAKDIEKAARPQLPSNFSFPDYYKFALKNLNFTEKYKDLADMLAVLEQY